MEATKNALPANKRLRMAADLLWFASASLGAGLLAAIVVAALAMLLAQPAYASRPAPRLVVPAAESPIVLQKLKVSAEITGSVAITPQRAAFACRLGARSDGVHGPGPGRRVLIRRRPAR